MPRMPPEELNFILFQIVAKMYANLPEGTVLELDPIEVALISLADRTFNEEAKDAKEQADDLKRQMGVITSNLKTN
jgi:hypothetical protein